MAEKIFLCGGKFARFVCNGKTCIVKYVDADGIVSPTKPVCEGEDGYDELSAEIAACSEESTVGTTADPMQVDFNSLFEFLLGNCLQIKNCEDKPLLVQLDLSNLDTDGDGIINVEGDVNAEVNLDPITTLLESLSELLSGCLTVKSCEGESVAVEIDWTGLADVCLQIKNCPDTVLDTSNETLEGIANAIVESLAGCLKFETCNGEPLPVTVDGTVTVEGTVALDTASIAALAAAIALALQSLPVTIDNDCTNPVPIATCPDSPLEVTVVDEPVDVVEVDTEFVCNDATNVYDMLQIITTNGVPAEPVTTPTTVPCDAPAPDFEQVRECRDGVVNIITNQIFADGTASELSAVMTAEECPPVTEAIHCWKDKFVEGGLDNTFTNFNHTNQNYTVSFSDGSEDSFAIASATDWTNQVEQMATGLGSVMPWAQAVESFCTNGCGGLPSPIVELSKMLFRYVGFRICPGDVGPVSVKYESDQTKKPAELILQYIETDTIYLDRCVDCDGNEKYSVVGTGEDYEPVCAIPCAEEFPEVAEPSCSVSQLEGVWCDNVVAGDPEVDDEVVASDILIFVTTCGTTQTLSYSQPDGDSIVPYEPQGEIVNCETLLPPEVDPPACPEGQRIPVNIGGGFYFIQDNSNFDPAPNPHITNGLNFELTYYDAAGAIVGVWQQTADPLFNNFITTAGDALSGCTVLPVCANHTSPRGCNVGHVANLAGYPAYDPPTAPGDIQNNLTNPDQSELWASGWLVDCGACQNPPVRVEITNSSDPAYIGASKDLIVYTKPDELGYLVLTCDGPVYLDCNGNVLPGLACCPKPWTDEVKTALDCALTTCPDDCENGSTYINGRPPAGEPWSWGPYSGDNLNDFEAALSAAGYNVIQIGEKHQICPPFGAFGESPAQVTNAVATFDATVEPNIDPDYVSATDCAIRTVPCGPLEVDGLPDLVDGCADIDCSFAVENWDSSNTQPDRAVVNPDTGVWNIIPSQTNPNTSMNNLLEKLNQGCAIAAVYVEETNVSASSGWIVVPAAAVTGDATGYQIAPDVGADFGGCDPAEALAALEAGAAGLTITNGGAFQAGPLVPAENNNIVFAVPPDNTANGRCLTLTTTGEAPPKVLPVQDDCVVRAIESLQSSIDTLNENILSLIGEDGDECPCDNESTDGDRSFSVSFKASGIVSVLTDKGEAVTSGPYDFPAPLEPPQSSANDTQMAAAAADIEAVTGGTVELEYTSTSILEIRVAGTACELISASDDSNPGPHNFTEL